MYYVRVIYQSRHTVFHVFRLIPYEDTKISIETL
jgi:hypothetical protein